MSVEKYTLDMEKIKDIGVHLTNYSVAKKATAGDGSGEEAKYDCDYSANKVNLQVLKEKLERSGISWSTFFQKLKFF